MNRVVRASSHHELLAMATHSSPNLHSGPGVFPVEPIERPHLTRKKGDPRYERQRLISLLPQAEDLQKLVAVVRDIRLGTAALLEILGESTARGVVGPRNLKYYLSAARLLNMLDGAKIRTPYGRALIDLRPRAQICRLSYAFEASEVGREWLRFSGVKSLSKLDPRTAADFVTDFRGNEPETETWRRRTHTLKRWCEEFKLVREMRVAVPRGIDYEDINASVEATAFDRGTSGRIVRQLAWRSENLDIATAYFRLEGFRELSAALFCQRIRLLIGSDDQSREDLETLLSLFRASLRPDRRFKLSEQRAVVEHLYALITEARLSISYFEARTTHGLHAKVYIGETGAYVTSANLTLGGLRNNIEGGELVQQPATVAYLRERFDLYWSEADPITEAIARTIEEAWKQHTDNVPYHVYLRILDELFGALPRLPANAYPLANFQEAIVAMALRSITEHRKLLLIAPTGIGKMVMASYIAKVLCGWGRIQRIIVVCKNEALRDIWVEKLRAFRLGHDLVRVYDLERWPDGAGELRDLFKSLGGGDLVIVDESHHFRRDDSNRSDALGEFLCGPSPANRPWALFLTATPVSTDLSNLNRQLEILGGTKLRELADVAHSPDILNVALGPLMATFGPKSGKYVGIDFGGIPRYLANVAFRDVKYASGLGRILAEIAEVDLGFNYVDETAAHEFESDAEGMTGDKGGLDRDAPGHFIMRALRVLLARRVESSLESLKASIEALQGAITKRRFVPDENSRIIHQLARLAEMVADEQERTRAQHPPKLVELLKTMRGIKPHIKVLIFSEYRPTVKMLAEFLRRELPQRMVEFVTGELGAQDKRKLFRRFAPIAQGVETPAGPSLDVLVATDSISEGESLQDASVVINYDITWTPLTLVQRIGRVDRFTRDKRRVQVFNFMPSEADFVKIVDIEETVKGRAGIVQQLSGTTMFGDHERTRESLSKQRLELVREISSGQRDYAKLRESVLEKPLPPSAIFSILWEAKAEDIKAARRLTGCAMARCPGPRSGLLVLLGLRDRRVLLWQDETGKTTSAPGPQAYETLLSYVGLPPREPCEISADEVIARDRRVDGMIEQWCNEADVQADGEVRYLAVLEVTPEATPIKRTQPSPKRTRRVTQVPLFGAG